MMLMSFAAIRRIGKDITFNFNIHTGIIY
jgi:hypothetical protein